jgi:MFS family permease
MREYLKYSGFAALFGFGGSVNGSMTYYLGIPAAYLAYLGAGATQIGLLTAIMWAGFSIPQLWAAYATEARTVKKRFMASALILSSLTWLLVGGGILVYGAAKSSLLVWIFLLVYAWAVSWIGMFMPANFSLLFKITPTAHLGHLIGIVFAIQFLGSFAGGFAINAINRAWNAPGNYTVLFLLTVAISIIIAGILLWIREPEGESVRPAPSFGDYLKKCAVILRTDRLFLRFLVAKWLMSGHYVIMAFLLVYLIRTHGFDPRNAGWIVSFNALGLALAGFTLAKISDAFGPKYMLLTSQLIAVLYVSLVLFVPSPSLPLLCLIFVITGLAEMSDNVGYTNMSLFCCPTEDKSTYIAVTNVGIIPFMILLPMLIGRMIDLKFIGYEQTLFIALGMMISAIFFILLFLDNPPEYVRMKIAARAREAG